MFETIFAVYKTIIVFKVLVTRVIRRINIDYINLPLMRIAQISEGMKVVTFNDGMIWVFISIENSLTIVLMHNRYLPPELLLDIFGRIFPHKTILLGLSKKFLDVLLLSLAKFCTALNGGDQ